MSALSKFLSDCKAEGHDGVFPSMRQMLQLQKDEAVWCNPERIEEQKQRLIKLKQEGKYPLLDPHEGMGDVDVDARFICKCNALHINGDNGIQTGMYKLDTETEKYIGRDQYEKQIIKRKWDRATIFERIIIKLKGEDK